MTGKRFGRVLAIVLALTMLAGMVPAFAAGETAESVYVNGNIYTMDDDNPHATAMAIRGDKLLYVGDKAGAEAYYISGVTKVVDLQGQTVLPGLIEGHMHVPNLGQSMLMIDAFWKPKEVILQAVKEAAEAAGMKKPTAGQVEYVELGGGSKAEVYQAESDSLLSQLTHSVKSGIGALVEYFR